MRVTGYLAAAAIVFAAVPVTATTITVGSTPLTHPTGGVDRGTLSVATPSGWWDAVHSGALSGSGFNWVYNPVDPVRGFLNTFAIENRPRENMTKVLTITVVSRADFHVIDAGMVIDKFPSNHADFWPVTAIHAPWPPAALFGASSFYLEDGNWIAQFQYLLRPQPSGEYVSFQAFALANDIPDITRVEIDITCVPEPGTWALLVIGFGAVGSAQRRRRGVVIA